MINTLRITLMAGHYAESNWHAVLEVDTSTTLQDLHYIIQNAVNFDDDHMYEFFTARTPRSRLRERYDTDEVDIDTVLVDDVFPLKKGDKLFYLFDFGDDWLFQISKTRHKPFDPKPGVSYPRLVSEEGERPEQYPPYE